MVTSWRKVHENNRNCHNTPNPYLFPIILQGRFALRHVFVRKGLTTLLDYSCVFNLLSFGTGKVSSTNAEFRFVCLSAHSPPPLPPQTLHLEFFNQFPFDFKILINFHCELINTVSLYFSILIKKIASTSALIEKLRKVCARQNPIYNPWN